MSLGRILAFLCLVVSVAVPREAGGQKTVWDQPEKLAGVANRPAGRLKEGFDTWKKQLQQWGLDTNYRQSLSITGQLNTNGWSLGLIYQQAWAGKDNRSGRIGKSSFYTLRFSEVKHEKQTRQRNGENPYPDLGNAAPFVFGKVNNLYLLQLGCGKERLLLPHLLEGNVSVSLRYSGGFSLAMLKPYYLRLIYTSYTPDPVVTLKEERYSADNSALFLDRERIFGGARWDKGIAEIDYVPGIFVEAAFVLIPAKNKQFIQAVTFGGQFSAYTKALPIMAEKRSYPYVGSLFAGISLGKR